MYLRLHSTQRFSDRVSNYIQYRPTYPATLLDTLTTSCGLNPQSFIADIGSGTGKLTQLLLDRSYRVIGVEPNKEMREAAEAAFSQIDTFSSSSGQAEATGLAPASVDLIVAAQAFHWFDPAKTRQEFLRLLKPSGHLALLWNRRRLESPFHQAYDRLLRDYAPDYANVKQRTDLTQAELADFFAPGPVATFEFENVQRFDLASFLGRMQSSSYTPKSGAPEHGALVAAVTELFNQHQISGGLNFEYRTFLYLGQFLP